MNIESYILLSGFAILVLSPFVFRRFSRAKTNTYGSFAVGARNFGWFRIGAGLSATFIGGAAVVNLAGLGYTYSWYALADVLPTSLALLLSSIWLVPKISQKNGFSIGGFLKTNSRVANAAVGLLSSLVYTLITAAQIVALIKITSPFLHFEPHWIALGATLCIATYVLYGGYSSITVTDVVQFLVMKIFYFGLVGFTLLTTASAPAAQAAASIAPQAMPLDLIMLLAAPLLFVPVSQDLHIRVNSAKNSHSARWGVVLAGSVYLLFGMISISIGRAVAFDGVVLPSADDAVPFFLNNHFGAFAIVPVTAIVCVVVSTLDSVLFAASSSLAYDFWDRFRGKESNSDSNSPRVAIFIVLGIALLIALQAPRILQLVLAAVIIYISVLVPMLVGRLLGKSSTIMGWLALVSLFIFATLEAMHLTMPFRAFAYTLAHLAVVLCIPKDPTPHEKIG